MKEGKRNWGLSYHPKTRAVLITFTTNINIKGEGSYPLISNMGTLQEGVVIGVLKSSSDNPDEVYAMDREE